eukprot:2879915-Amphidinium_carterae.2
MLIHCCACICCWFPIYACERLVDMAAVQSHVLLREVLYSTGVKNHRNDPLQMPWLRSPEECRFGLGHCCAQFVVNCTAKKRVGESL